jgi:CDGSH-type Zn-finger protein
MSEVKIQARKHGPLLVSGEVEVLDSNGAVMQVTKQVALCRCGHSSNKPFCDGQHKANGFQSECIKAANV